MSQVQAPGSLELNQNRAVQHAIRLLLGRSEAIWSISGFRMVEAPPGTPQAGSPELGASNLLGTLKPHFLWSLVDAPGFWFVLRKFSLRDSRSPCSACLLK